FRSPKNRPKSKTPIPTYRRGCEPSSGNNRSQRGTRSSGGRHKELLPPPRRAPGSSNVSTASGVRAQRGGKHRNDLPQPRCKNSACPGAHECRRPCFQPRSRTSTVHWCKRIHPSSNTSTHYSPSESSRKKRGSREQSLSNRHRTRCCTCSCGIRC